jgi:CRISPR-associated endonuclease/helicase Cas3
MDRPVDGFDAQFLALTGHRPFRWQQRLFEHLAAGHLPSALDLPTGLGKTSVMAIWLIARAHGAKLPRRLVYIVDRRAVVDQATMEAEKLRCAPDKKSELQYFKAKLGLTGRSLPISTLRGQFIDNREWLADPAAAAIIIGTVDMIGSRPEHLSV